MGLTREQGLLLMTGLLIGVALGCLNLTTRNQAYTCDHPLGDCHVLYDWVKVEYDWPSPEMKSQYEADGRFQVSHNFISGIKVYK